MSPDIKNKILRLLVCSNFFFLYREIEKCIQVYSGGQISTETHIAKNNISFLIRTLVISLELYKKFKPSYKEISNT